MNCKVGDLAITFGAPVDNGLLVEVLEAYEGGLVHKGYGHCWRVKSLGSPFGMTEDLSRLSQIAAWPDSMLKPLGRPGEHATDIDALVLVEPEVLTS